MSISLETRVNDLSHDQLLELVIDAIKEDSGIRKHFASRLASSTERHSKLKRSINKLANLKSSYSDKYAEKIANEISDLIDEVVSFGKSQPAEAFQLLCSIQSHHLAVYDAVHDRGGAILLVYVEVLAGELVAYVQRTLDSATLIAGLRTICFHQPWSSAIDVVEKMAMYLPDEVVDAFIPELEAWTESGPEDPYYPQAHSISELLQAAIFAGAGRIDDYIRVKTASSELRSSDHVKLAEMYLEHDDLKGAKQHLELIDKENFRDVFAASPIWDRYMTRCTDQEEIRGYLREQVIKGNRYHDVPKFRMLFGNDVVEAVLVDAVDTIRAEFGKRNVSVGLMIMLVREGHSAEISQIILRDDPVLEGIESLYDELSIALVGAGSHLAASMILRSLIKTNLSYGEGRELTAAVKQLVRLDDLAHAVTDWGTFISHDDFIKKIRERHGSFPAFWKRVEKAKGITDR